MGAKDEARVSEVGAAKGVQIGSHWHHVVGRKKSS